MSLIIPALAFGDILLKDRGSPFNTLTKIKTWSDVSHSDLYIGTQFGHTAPQVITAHPSGGVDFYPLSLEAMVYVLRPQPDHIPSQAGFHWFEQVRGQAYDYWGFLSFFFAQAQGADNGRQFCSEVIARIFKKGGAALLHPRVDADTYAPATFLLSPFCRVVWSRDGVAETSEAQAHQP